ncbi:vWA domain-containing protein [Planctomycetota bacterium]
MKVNRVLLAVMAPVLMCALVCANMAAGKDPGRAKVEKAPVGKKAYSSICHSLQHKDWLLRAFGALEARQYGDAKVLLQLRRHYQEDKDPMVKAFLLDSIASWPAEDLQAFFDKDFVEQTVKLFFTAKDEFTGDAAMAFLNSYFKINLEKNLRKWNGFWKASRKKVKKIHEKAVKAWEKNNGSITELKVEDVVDPKAKPTLKKRVLDILSDFKANGLEVALLVDESSNMSNIHSQLKQAGPGIARTWKLLAPKMRVGILPYSENGPNTVFAPTGDMEKIDMYFSRISSNAGDVPLVPLHRVLAAATSKMSWEKRPLKHMIVLGGNAAGGYDRPKVSAKIKTVVNQGFVIHFFGLNHGSLANPRNVEEFETFAQSGGGADVILTRDTDVGAKLCSSVFGANNMDEVMEFCSAMVRYHTPVRKK